MYLLTVCISIFDPNKNILIISIIFVPLYVNFQAEIFPLAGLPN